MPKLLIDIIKAACIAGLATLATVLIDLYYETHSLGRSLFGEHETRMIKGLTSGAVAGSVSLLASRGLS